MTIHRSSVTGGELKRRVAFLPALVAAAALLAPAFARADVVVTATLPQPPAPLANAISRHEPSTLNVLVSNSGSQIVREVDITVPSQYGNITAASAPDATWSATLNGATAKFLSVSCTGPGIPPGDSTLFSISFNGPATSNNGDNTTSSSFTVDGYTSSGANVCDPSPASDLGSTFAAPVKALYITGTIARNSATQATVTWTVTNNNGSQTVNSVLITTVVNPSTGFTLGSCTTTIGTINAGASKTASCTYNFATPGTYTFSASARDGNGTGTSSAAGTVAGSFTYATAPIVTWTKTLVVAGLASNTLKFSVGAPSNANVTKVELTNGNTGTCAPASWTLSATASDFSATNGLTYQAPPTSTSADVVFGGGTLNQGLSSDITVAWSAVPAPASAVGCTLGVKVTYGSTSTASQTVNIDVPLPDVTQFAIQNTPSGKVLTWNNTSGNGATHDGVVIFREPTGTAPAFPVQLKQYSVGRDRVVFVSSGNDTQTQFTDPAAGNFNYRICNHDSNLVYSRCSTGLPSGAGWLDSGAVVSGGWTDALDGDTRVRAAFVPGGRLAQGSLAPYVAILDVATGQLRSTTTIPGLPTTYTPVVPLANGRTVLFAADQSGNVTAIDATTGAVYWGPKSFPGENFTAGVAGITRSFASATFRAAYPMDILLLGSATGSGNVYAVDTTNGNILWSFAAGASVTGLINYDSATDLFYVPTRGAGVKAYTIVGSSPTVRAPVAPLWVNPDPTGNYGFHCTRFGNNVACIDVNGVLRVLDKTTGALKTATSYTTLITTTPNAPVYDSGSAQAGLVISSATNGVQVLTVNTTVTPYTITSRGTWAPPAGVRISSPAVFQDAARRYLVVGGGNGTADGQRLYRLSLDTVAQQARSPQVSALGATLTLTQPAYDSTTGLYLFGTNDGHLWAVPAATGWVTP